MPIILYSLQFTAGAIKEEFNGPIALGSNKKLKLIPIRKGKVDYHKKHSPLNQRNSTLTETFCVFLWKPDLHLSNGKITVNPTSFLADEIKLTKAGQGIHEKDS